MTVCRQINCALVKRSQLNLQTQSRMPMITDVIEVSGLKYCFCHCFAQMAMVINIVLSAFVEFQMTEFADYVINS